MNYPSGPTQQQQQLLADSRSLPRQPLDSFHVLRKLHRGRYLAFQPRRDLKLISIESILVYNKSSLSHAS